MTKANSKRKHLIAGFLSVSEVSLWHTGEECGDRQSKSARLGLAGILKPQKSVRLPSLPFSSDTPFPTRPQLLILPKQSTN